MAGREIQVPTVYARTLRRAAELVGGEDVLAARLGVPWKQLRRWIHDLVKPPPDVFVAAADIVGEHELKMLRELKRESKTNSGQE